MAVPSPAIPTFVDGNVLSASQLNALGSNISNLFTYNQGSFNTQRPCVIAKQTTGQTILTTSDTLVNFNTAPVNTNNMWTASVANTITIQTAGIYWVFAQTCWPVIAGPSFSIAGATNLFKNGTNPPSNTIASDVSLLLGQVAPASAGTTNTVGIITNLAVGDVLHLDVWQNCGGTLTLGTAFGGTFLGAIYLTPST